MIEPKQFTYEDKIIAHYAAVRKRIMRVRRKPAEPVAEPEKTVNLYDILEQPTIEVVCNVRAISTTYEMKMELRPVDYSEMQWSGALVLVRKSIAQIVAEVLKRYPGITREMVRGHCRKRAYLPARYEVIYMVKKQRPDLSLSAIGRAFGGRDHATIISSIKAHRKRAGIS